MGAEHSELAVALALRPYQREAIAAIALLNNDLVLDPDWMARMVAVLDAHRALGSCACKMLSYDHRDTVDAAGVSVLTCTQAT